MENIEKKIVATIKSPSRKLNFREGNGFSLAEIAASGKSIKQIKDLKIKIDYFRKSAHNENIELLKEVKIIEKKDKKKKEYVPKEKRIKAKPKVKVKKKIPPKTEIPPPEEPLIEEKQKVKAPKAKKPKIKEPEVEKEVEVEQIPLTELSGLGPATAKKFKDVGVESVEQLLEETPEELAPLIPGCSEERISKWIKEGRELLDK